MNSPLDRTRRVFTLLWEEVTEAPQGDRLAAGERLGVRDARQMPPEAGPVEDRVDHAGPPLGLVVDELGPVAPQRLDLRREVVGDVHQQARPLDDPEVDAEVIKDPRGVVGGAGDVGLRELAPEPGILDQFWLWSMQGSLKSIYECIKAFSETDLTEDLKKIDVPTLLLHAKDDQIVESMFSLIAQRKAAEQATVAVEVQ